MNQARAAAVLAPKQVPLGNQVSYSIFCMAPVATDIPERTKLPWLFIWLNNVKI